jgi:hypothetical protein
MSCGGLQWYNFYTIFNQNLSSGSRVETCEQTDGQTHRVSAEWLALLLRILEVPGSNVSPKAGYPD